MNSQSPSSDVLERLCELHRRLSLCFEGATGEAPPARPRDFEPQWADLETVLDAAAAMPTIERLSAELENMRAKMRCVISHATGGHTGGEDAPDLSLNEISVRISRHVSRVYQGGKDAALSNTAENG